MEPADLPPSYSWISSNSPAPIYSECPSPSERVLQKGPCVCWPSSESASQKFIYKSDSLEVRLHPPRWGSVLPAYGLAGTVEGVLTFRKTCTHVLEVSVSLLGCITTSASQHATIAVPGIDKVQLLKKKTVLFSAKAGSSAAMNGEHPFALQFPHHIDNGTNALPPSYTVYQPGVSTEIAYHVRVDVVRKGLRRHEKLTVPVLYLPKSRPTSPPLEHIPWSARVDGENDERVRCIQLSPTWPGRSESNSPPYLEELPVISLTLPSAQSFASGDTIPLSLKIESPGSPALAKMLSYNVHLSLVKRQKTWISLGHQVSVREHTLSRAGVYLADDTREGLAYLRLELKAGEAGRECSWRVDGAVAIEVSTSDSRTPVREHLKDFPTYRCEVPVALTTDPFGTLQNELFALSGVPFPALGLSDPARHLRALA
ncbi:hypothetical protein BN946_scf184798.g62 [Trametes cinnabarina]|uniref:Arrestin-like N-terminal domain-containing protein n=1 Tax=Pycnoporus cinnabarinus TaxID=5643 RepID=A0A060S8E7_PYCCI|nr:hypothetical protein BN946_scf184798.g62 [Trametes cinnabarina]